MIQRLLYRQVYRPLRRGGLFGRPVPRVACVAATFAASAALHCYPLVIAGASINDLCSVVLYFTIHCILVLAEPFIFGAGTKEGRGDSGGGDGEGIRSVDEWLRRKKGTETVPPGSSSSSSNINSLGRWFVLLAHLVTVSLIVQPFRSLAT